MSDYIYYPTEQKNKPAFRQTCLKIFVYLICKVGRRSRRL